MAEVNAVKILVYNSSDFRLCFAKCEYLFILAVKKHITESKTKFNLTAANMLPEAASIVKDFIS